MAQFPDLITSKIAKYLLGDNSTLLELRKVFSDKDDILIGHLVLDRDQSQALYFSKDPFAQWVIQRVHTLDLWGCTGVTDVSALGNLHTLYLSGIGVTDASALGNLHTLYLSDTGVTDVSALGNLHTLNLWGCTGVTDVSALGNLHTLNLSRTGVTNLETIKDKVKNLYY